MAKHHHALPVGLLHDLVALVYVARQSSYICVFAFRHRLGLWCLLAGGFGSVITCRNLIDVRELTFGGGAAILVGRSEPVALQHLSCLDSSSGLFNVSSNFISESDLGVIWSDPLFIDGKVRPRKCMMSS